ncbi:hypothetical protein [Paenibacillus sp. 481]|uniref:hypothetical protein n=1 Tax=Paenibacillus sp. 481 TaxID=2835869 RepID=UPI001E3E4CDD|nr:hypothetical protein [Paenibacillus sp. 481]UHA75185.1 hypothetical protein KIK04_09255 [Paenibacillus sp. 481]
MENNSTKENIHRKFLKVPSKRELQVGDYIPNIILKDGNESFRMHDLIKRNHLIATFFSTDCDSCEPAMEALGRFQDINPNLNIVAFVNTTDELLHMLREYYQNKILLFMMPKAKMNEELQTYQFPKGYTLNSLGQVLAVETCSEVFWYNKLKDPLRKLDL